MATNYQFQLQAIRRKVKSMGYDPDLYDLHSHIDRSLTLQENMRIIVDDIRFMTSKKKISRGTSGGRTGNVDRLEQANSIFAAMKSSRQRMDLSKQAKTTFEVGDLNKKNFNMWKKKPSRFDIMGVDSKY